MWTWAGLRNRVLDGGLNPPSEGAIWGHLPAHYKYRKYQSCGQYLKHCHYCSSLFNVHIVVPIYWTVMQWCAVCGDRYQQLLSDCHQCYFQQRLTLLSASVSSAISDLVSRHSRDHCALVCALEHLAIYESCMAYLRVLKC